MKVEGIPIPSDIERSLVAYIVTNTYDADFVVYDLDLRPDDFGDAICQRMYQIVCDLTKNMTQPDLTVVLEEYERRFENSTPAWNAYASTKAKFLSRPDLRTYAEIIETSSEARQLIKLGTEIAQIGYARNSHKPGEMIAEADHLFDTYTKTHRRAPIITPEEREQRVRERMQERRRRHEDGQPIGIPFGFEQIDEITGGMLPGRMYVFGGESGSGKTAMLHTIAMKTADAGYTVLEITLEMLEEHVSDRELAALLDTDSKEIERGAYADDEKMDAAITRIGMRPLYVYDEAGLTVEEIPNLLWTMERRYGTPRVVVVDYAQILDTLTNGRKREEEVARIARGLKNVAKQFGIAVVTAAQLNDNEQFRESRVIRHEAWAAFIIRRIRRKDGLVNQDQWDDDEHYQQFKCPMYQRAVFIDKNRSGEFGYEIRLGWNPETTTYYQPERKERYQRFASHTDDLVEDIAI